MRYLPACLATLAAIAHASAALAQHAGAAPAASGTIASESRQFDFLVGDWSIVATPKTGSLAALIHGAPKLVGTWTARRAFDGRGVEDELRIVDASGNPASLVRALRIWSPTENRWLVATVDAYRARVGQAKASWRGGAMHVEASGVDAQGKPYLARSRFEPGDARFRVVQDRSSDGGESWEEAVLVIEATRAEPAG